MMEYITEEIKDGTLSYRKDVGELIRCKDCVSRDDPYPFDDTPRLLRCQFNGHIVGPNDFCSFATRRKNSGIIK